MMGLIPKFAIPKLFFIPILARAAGSAIQTSSAIQIASTISGGLSSIKLHPNAASI
jgi:hypothetical protein